MKEYEEFKAAIEKRIYDQYKRERILPEIIQFTEVPYEQHNKLKFFQIVSRSEIPMRTILGADPSDIATLVCHTSIRKVTRGEVSLLLTKLLEKKDRIGKLESSEGILNTIIQLKDPVIITAFKGKYREIHYELMKSRKIQFNNRLSREVLIHQTKSAQIFYHFDDKIGDKLFILDRSNVQVFWKPYNISRRPEGTKNYVLYGRENTPLMYLINKPEQNGSIDFIVRTVLSEPRPLTGQDAFRIFEV